ncbi:MAG: TetR/AcrR family transcriptional regulator [Pseudomonadota bacterium]
MQSIVHTKKHKKGQETRDKILEEAVDLFCQYGFTKASTRQLVSRVGMTSSAIYNHFDNKEKILFTIIQRAGEKVLATLNGAIEEYDDPEECLKQMIIRMLSLFKDSEMRKEIAIFLEQVYQLPGDLRNICSKQHREIFDLFRDKIREIKKEMRMNPINETVAAFAIVGAMNWVYQWFKDNGALSIEDIGNELTLLLFEGLVSADTSPDHKGRGKQLKQSMKRMVK